MNAESDQNCLEKLEIPEIEFKEIFQVPLKNGLTRPKRVRGHGIKMVGMCEVFAHDRIGTIDMERVPLGEKETDYLLAPKDLVFARQSLVLSGAGKCSIFLDITEPTTFESHLIRARLNQDISDPMFYYYFFKSKVGRHKIEAITEQVAAAGIRSSDLAKITIPFPPKNMQQSIAGYLGSLDDFIEMNKRINKTLGDLAHTIFKSWFIDFDPVRAKAEGKQPFGMDEETAALFPSALEDSELGEIPRGWSIGTIGEMADIVGGSTPSTKEPSYWGDEYFFVTPKDMSDLKSPFILGSERRITKEGLGCISSGLLPVGTVLLSSRAPIGYLAIAEVPISVNQGIIAMVPNGKLPSSYLLFWTESNINTILNNANGTTFQEISKSNYRPIKMIVPPKEIVSRYDFIVGPLLAKAVSNLREISTITALRDSLLPKMLSGEIRIDAASGGEA